MRELAPAARGGPGVEITQPIARLIADLCTHLSTVSSFVHTSLTVTSCTMYLYQICPLKCPTKASYIGSHYPRYTTVSKESVGKGRGGREMPEVSEYSADPFDTNFIG